MANKYPTDAHEALKEMYANGWSPTTVRREISCSQFKLSNPDNAMFSDKEEREILRLFELKGKRK